MAAAVGLGVELWVVVCCQDEWEDESNGHSNESRSQRRNRHDPVIILTTSHRTVHWWRVLLFRRYASYLPVVTSTIGHAFVVGLFFVWGLLVQMLCSSKAVKGIYGVLLEPSWVVGPLQWLVPDQVGGEVGDAPVDEDAKKKAQGVLAVDCSSKASLLEKREEKLRGSPVTGEGLRALAEGLQRGELGHLPSSGVGGKDMVPFLGGGGERHGDLPSSWRKDRLEGKDEGGLPGSRGGSDSTRSSVGDGARGG